MINVQLSDVPIVSVSYRLPGNREGVSSKSFNDKNFSHKYNLSHKSSFTTIFYKKISFKIIVCQNNIISQNLSFTSLY